MKCGDLIRFTSGRYKGRYATTTTGLYTHRFMDMEDYEMVQHGMGEFAGRYGSAFNVVFSDGGVKRKLSFSDNRFDIITSNEKRSDAKEA